MKLAITTVDAFTNKVFSGNPAAVCLLDQELTQVQMQTIAMEMNLSETAYVKRTSEPDAFSLRWFTPTVEIDLCGHATLASAFWMVKSGWAKPNETIRFQTRSGELVVKSDGEWIEMDFPLIPTVLERHPFFDGDFFGAKIINSAKLKKNWIVELEDASAVESCDPDFSLVKKHSEEGIIITAVGKGTFDIYSRFFGPKVGIDEDPVTGFAHCALMDYWFQRSGQSRLKAYQASKRGGELYLEKREDRVLIKGQAVKVFSGELEF
ncbi:PhzF family phenazine biosynthesis protein [Algoriphagus sp. C2-6-M1]|uniref:PhzF family phenazine biosynthesis protein n=1 Tax=Algoriphagus persicinus TaxID=3108754 RepID=UPI002B3C1DAF|nr:PhzF family phenazine biosynthesis protein [Algoriphagus sp. C2-6-M1]MEB2781757.1 PhzF family phenazine biosynthesis protein [Algoriphagus sp. C2-6-M1]